MAALDWLQSLLGGGGQQAPGAPQSYDVGPDTIPLSLDRTPVNDPYTGTALHQLMGKLGDIGTAIPGLVERAQLGGMNALGMRQSGGDIYRSKLPVAPGIEALGDAATFATGGLANSLYPSAGALRAGARYAVPPGTMPGLLADEFGGIRAFHGSPHDFDRFDLSKIGTGEGAQAYGHGLYFAENPATAQIYRDQVKNMPLIDSINAKLSEIARERDKIRESGALFDQASPERQRFMDLAAEYDRLMAEKMKPGHMYEVDINADPKAFLDWDKPFMDQPQAVQDTLQAHLKNLQASGQPLMSGYMRDVNRGLLPGGSVYQGLGRGTSESAAEAWQQAGVPGVRYLDQGSRIDPAATQQKIALYEGLIRNDPTSPDIANWASRIAEIKAEAAKPQTSNYAIFDPSIIEILRKYGIIPPVAAGGGLLATGSEPPM